MPSRNGPLLGFVVTDDTAVLLVDAKTWSPGAAKWFPERISRGWILDFAKLTSEPDTFSQAASLNSFLSVLLTSFLPTRAATLSCPA
jgi:hypothetical protein